MNRSWTHQNIARSVQFGGIYPIYRVGKVHRALNNEKSKPSVASGGEVIQAYTPTRGGSWRNTKKIAVSWTINGVGVEHSISFFYKGGEYLLGGVPSNYHLKAVSVNKQFLILLFVTGSESSLVPLLMRKYTSFLQSGGGITFSEILQAELSISLGFAANVKIPGTPSTPLFTSDGRTVGVAVGSGGVNICRFNPDFTSYTITHVSLGGVSAWLALVDGLGFSVLGTVLDEYSETPGPTTGEVNVSVSYTYEYRYSQHHKILHIQPTWDEGFDPYNDNPLAWEPTTFLDNFLPEHSYTSGEATTIFYEDEFHQIYRGETSINVTQTDQTLYMKSMVYSDTSGILVYTFSGGPTDSGTSQMVLVLDGTTHVLKTISGTDTEYSQGRFTLGLVLPGTNLLYIRWAFPDPYGLNVFELHIDLKTRAFTFHEHPSYGSGALALTTL